MSQRVEKDALGQVRIPVEAYYGITTQRVLQDFNISGLKEHPKFLEAYIFLKKACALANIKTAALDRSLGEAIVQASDEILEGKLREQFVVDVFQMGAGTSYNMNCNEVIANRANEILGYKKGLNRPIHPNDHVNMSQSTNDTFPTAMRIAILLALRDLYKESLLLEKSLQKKGKKFVDIVKAGRTHLQDAVPITLGQELTAYSLAIGKRRKAIVKAAKSCLELGIGGTAVGTEVNTKVGYREEVIARLNIMTGLKLKPAKNLFEVMQSQAAVADVSAAIKNLALELIRISNDLRLLSSGPNTGLAEIRLPAVVQGSSIMPGKVNPSMLEMLNMVCFQVVGNDLAVSMAVQAGQLELNVMMPVMAFNILFSIEILINAMRQTRVRCTDGIEADENKCQLYSETTLGLATVLNPIIGYEKASEVVKHALKENKRLVDIIQEENILSKAEISKFLHPARMTRATTDQRK